MTPLVGLTEAAAREEFGNIRVLRAALENNDRARAERAGRGLLKVITTRRGRVLGAGMAGEKAGEIIQSWCLPIARKMNIKHIAGLILPYPTIGEINKTAAASFFTPTLYAERTRRLVRFLLSFG